MALVIIDRSKPNSNDPVRLARHLREASEMANYLDSIAANADAQDMFDVFGVEVGDFITFKNVVGNLVTALGDSAVTNYITNLG